MNLRTTIKRLRLIGAFLILLVAIGVMPAVFPSQVDAQEAHKHIPDSAVVAVVFTPKAAMTEPAFDLMPREVIDVFGDKELDIDLMELNRVTVLVDNFSDVENPPDFGLIFQFDSDQTLGGKLAENTDEAEFEGRKAFRLEEGPMELFIVPVDSKTILFGSAPMLSAMINASNATSNLTALLNTAEPTDHFGVFVAMEDMRDVIKNNLPPVEMMSEQEKRFRILPDLIKSIYMRHSFSAGGISEVKLTANSEGDAKKLEFLLVTGVDMIKDQLLEEGGFGEGGWGFGDEDYDEAMRAYADRIAGLAKDLIKDSRDGDSMKIDLTEIPGISPLIGVGGAGFVMPMMFFGRAVPMGGVEVVDAVAIEAPAVDTADKMRQIMIAMHNFHDVNGSMPAQAIQNENGEPLLSWRVAILPYLEEQDLYDQFRLDEPWDSEHNIALLDQIPRCYVNSIIDMGSDTIFLGVAGEGTAFGDAEGVRLQDVSGQDGTASTIMLVEVDPDAAIPWTKPADLQVDRENPMKNLGGIWGDHFYVSFMDASTRIAPVDVDAETLNNLFEMNDGNVVEIDW